MHVGGWWQAAGARVVLAATTLGPAVATAQPDANAETASEATADVAVETSATAAPGAESNERRAPRGWQPQWRRFQVWDYVGTAATIGAFYFVHSRPDPRGAGWTEPIPVLDEPFRNWMVGRSRSAREDANKASDYLWYVAVVHPVLDVAVATPIAHRDFRMTYELSLMNLQAFSVVSLWSRIFHKTVGRLRPNALGCDAEGPDYDYQCGKKSQLVSFPSGHTGVSMTGAGLVCAHHLQGHLYRHPVADGLACGAAVGVASTVGGLRIAADRHWMSDVLVGAGLGFATGYGLPTVLYYHPFWRTRRRTARRSDDLLVTGIVAPLPGGLGGVVQGRF